MYDQPDEQKLIEEELPAVEEAEEGGKYDPEDVEEAEEQAEIEDEIAEEEADNPLDEIVSGEGDTAEGGSPEPEVGESESPVAGDVPVDDSLEDEADDVMAGGDDDGGEEPAADIYGNPM